MIMLSIMMVPAYYLSLISSEKNRKNLLTFAFNII